MDPCIKYGPVVMGTGTELIVSPKDRYGKSSANKSGDHVTPATDHLTKMTANATQATGHVTKSADHMTKMSDSNTTLAENLIEADERVEIGRAHV